MPIVKKYFLLFLLFSSVMVNAQITLTLPNESGLVNSEKLVPVTVSDLTALSISSFQFQVNYDQTKISILGFSTTGTILNGASLTTKNDVPGFFRVAYATSGSISGGGVLLNVRVKFLAEGSSQLTYTPEYTSGTFTFRSLFSNNSGNVGVTAVNGTLTGTYNNFPPVFDAVSAKTVKEGQTLTFTVHATDPEGQTLIYANGTLPEGAAFSASTQQFTWTPTLEQAGPYNVIFMVSDGTNTVQVTVAIEVTDSNTAPEINLINPQSVSEGQSLGFTIEATDAEDDELTFSAGTLPEGAVFEAATQYFYWTPDFDQQGTYNVVFTVSDGKLSDEITVSITVVNVNQGPYFTKELVADTISVYEPAFEFTFQFEAEDPDNDQLTFTLDGSRPLGCSITSSGLFKWTPTASQVGMIYTITVKVSDGSLSATSTSEITVDKVVSARGNELPTKTALYQNYPNPFNPTTTIEYSIVNDSQVQISVFNILGQEIMTLVNSFERAGNHSVEFRGTNLESGIYIYRITAGNFVDVKRMMLLK